MSDETFYSNVLDEVFGYGPLEIPFREDSVSEVMVNGQDTFYME